MGGGCTLCEVVDGRAVREVGVGEEPCIDQGLQGAVHGGCVDRSGISGCPLGNCGGIKMVVVARCDHFADCTSRRRDPKSAVPECVDQRFG
ncbi:hypothetical protein BMS3Bbin02_01387 [bacterium BMS3Bbin02]|nr:hypothetical protein BMS3Bbin02_01387 [bacterium BMS3Bbin02]